MNVKTRTIRNLPWIRTALGFVAGVFVLLVLPLAADPAEPPGYALFLGRFHPLLVHLPIGFVVAAGLLEVFARSRRFEYLRPAVPFVLALGAAAAILAVGAGLFLAMSGGYDGGTLVWHKRLGIAVAVLVALTLFARLAADRYGRASYRQMYTALLVGTIGVVGLAGHLGGTLTHGAGYLTEHLPGPLRAAVLFVSGGDATEAAARIDDAVVYIDLIRPVLEARCTSCHGPDKAKGDLRLDTQEGILAGGEEGPVLVPGDAEASDLFHRVTLPPGHEDRMPPPGKPPLTLEEIELLRWWIDGGASFEQKVVDLEATPAVRLVLDWRYGSQADRPTGIFALDVPPADSAAFAGARAVGLSVLPLAADQPFVQVHAINAPDDFGDAQLSALTSFAPQVAWLDLSDTRVTDAGLAVVAQLVHLTRLHLEQTGVGDGGLVHLKGLRYLEYLNLYGTAVTDAGLDPLAALPELKRLYLWQTAVTEDGLRRFREQRPDVQVNAGFDAFPPSGAPVFPAAASE